MTAEASRDTQPWRKKPVVIEAAQFLEGEPIPKGICFGWKCDGDKHQHVHTIHDNQKVYVEFGDWIVSEPNGENFYPVKSDIFAANYDAAPGPSLPTEAQLSKAREDLSAMTKDRDLWQQAHDEDCPNKAALERALETRKNFVCKVAADEVVNSFKGALKDRDNHIDLAYAALGDVNRSIYLFDHIRRLREESALLRDQAWNDCVEAAVKACEAVDYVPEAAEHVGVMDCIEAVRTLARPIPAEPDTHGVGSIPKPE